MRDKCTCTSEFVDKLVLERSFNRSFQPHNNYKTNFYTCSPTVPPRKLFSPIPSPCRNSSGPKTLPLEMKNSNNSSIGREVHNTITCMYSVHCM